MGIWPATRLGHLALPTSPFRFRKSSTQRKTATCDVISSTRQRINLWREARLLGANCGDAKSISARFLDAGAAEEHYFNIFQHVSVVWVPVSRNVSSNGGTNTFCVGTPCVPRVSGSLTHQSQGDRNLKPGEHGGTCLSFVCAFFPSSTLSKCCELPTNCPFSHPQTTVKTTSRCTFLTTLGCVSTSLQKLCQVHRCP